MSSPAKLLKKSISAAKDIADAAASGDKASATASAAAPKKSSALEQERKKSSRKRAPVDYNEERVVVTGEEAVAEQSKNKKPKGGAPQIFSGMQPLPTRDAAGKLHFADHPDFTPNMTPKEVLRAGSFGGGYFRPIHCTVNEQDFKDAHKEFPKDWFEGLDVGRMITSKTYRADINTFGVKCGGSLEMWQSSGWITAIDPYGAFQWYCRFYLGRRSEDDARQISRFNQVMGPTGRFRTNLMNQIIRKNTRWDDVNVSPVIRQTLQHWGYRLTEADFKAHCKKKGYKVPG
ncbi:hypothetical protein VYU27_000870 [Nannochloropsis oceanica]